MALDQKPPLPGRPERNGRWPPHSWSLWSYRVATTLARPAAGTILRMRERRGKEEPARRGERFGIAGRPRPSGPLMWIHAASVGETMAVLPLVEALTAARSDLSVLVTTGTVTSARLAEARLPAGALHQFVALDAARYVNRFLDHWRPALAILTEQEIWPNHIVECTRRGIPLVLINARMSQASFERWLRRPGLARELFGRFDLMLAQSEELARRLSRLGARHVMAVGNLKVDAPPPPVDRAALAALSAGIGDRPRLLAASTHEGEETIVLAAHDIMRATLPSLLTIVVPRHPERGPQLAGQLKAAGRTVALRSRQEPITQGVDVYIADTIGELGTFYALSPVAFVGGSLVAKGGQNPIEAIRHGAAVLAGPHRSSFADLYAALTEAGGAIEVADADTLARAALGLLGDPLALARVRSGGEGALAELSGALARTMAAILPLLPRSEDAPRAA